MNDIIQGLDLPVRDINLLDSNLSSAGGPPDGKIWQQTNQEQIPALKEVVNLIVLVQVVVKESGLMGQR